METLKNILAVVAGLFVAFLFIMGIEAVSHMLFPLPMEYDPANPETHQVLSDQIPLAALLFVIVAYIVGSFIGGFMTGVIAKEKEVIWALITGTILLIFGIINLYTIPHPLWFMIVSIAVYIPFAYMGGLVAKRLKKQ